MIAGISGWQKVWKTGFGVALLLELLEEGYTKTVFANLAILTDKVQCVYLESAKLLERMVTCMKEKETGVSFFIDNSGQVIPNRFWKDLSQTKSMLGIYETDKMFRDIIHTYHKALPPDKILRQATEIEIKIKAIDREDEIVIYDKEDWRTGALYENLVFENISEYYDKYDYRQPVV